MERLIDPYDYLICFSVETTHDSSKYKTNYRRIYFDKTLARMANSETDLEDAEIIDQSESMQDPNFPQVIEMDW